ncbi:hypothetical protein D4R86_03900, partial [bacterium]
TGLSNYDSILESWGGAAVSSSSSSSSSSGPFLTVSGAATGGGVSPNGVYQYQTDINGYPAYKGPENTSVSGSYWWIFYMSSRSAYSLWYYPTPPGANNFLAWFKEPDYINPTTPYGAYTEIAGGSGTPVVS